MKEPAMPRVVEFTGPCSWLVEVRNPGFDDPDWYADSPADLTVVVECGAPMTGYTDGSWHCEAGHAMGTLEEELGPYGNEWQREQEERAAEFNGRR